MKSIIGIFTTFKVKQQTTAYNRLQTSLFMTSVSLYLIHMLYIYIYIYIFIVAYYIHTDINCDTERPTPVTYRKISSNRKSSINRTFTYAQGHVLIAPCGV